MEVTQQIWSFTPEGDAIILYEITNESGASVRLTNVGAAVVGINVPDRSGNLADVVLGYPTAEDYLTGDTSCMGKTPGRFANRIARGKFTLDGTEYRLPVNNGPNHLHGGPKGFSSRIWEGRVEGDRVIFALDSEEGDEGYPAALYTEVVYDWSDDNCLDITLLAQSNGTTIINLTNHTYFNLAGESSGSVLDHLLMLNASEWLPTDITQIPTGEIASVEGTPMDFRSAKPLGEDIEADFDALRIGAGYDHCWVVDGYQEPQMRLVAVLSESGSGRTLEVSSDQPGVQVYTGNFLGGSPKGKGGRGYEDRDGVAIECQAFPDSPNKPHFPSTTLHAGERYERHIQFRFGVE